MQLQIGTVFLMRTIQTMLRINMLYPIRLAKWHIMTFVSMKFILGMGSQTLGKELMEFYDFNPKMVSVSTIVQRRSKILPATFQYLFHEFNNEFSQTNFFHGYRLYAVTVRIYIFQLFLMIRRHFTVQMMIQKAII